jgi:hypothetical protein
MFTKLNLSDMETCCKIFPREILERIQVEQDWFGIEPELTAKVARTRAGWMRFLSRIAIAPILKARRLHGRPDYRQSTASFVAICFHET